MLFLFNAFTEGTKVQVGTLETVDLEFTEEKDFNEYILSSHEKNLYWLGGVNEKKIGRAEDDDIVSKNYFFFDFDVRQKHAEITNEEIKTSVWPFIRDCLNEDEGLRNWHTAVFTGNGIHLYYFGETFTGSKEVYRKAVFSLLEKAGKATNMTEELDKVCVNIARLARLPFSTNQKNKSAVEILETRDVKTDLFSKFQIMAEEIWAKEAIEKEKEVVVYGTNTVFGAINEIPVHELVSEHFGWEFNGRNFLRSNESGKKAVACFVPPSTNFLVQGGTEHLPDTHKGYSPFLFVKTMHGLDDRGTFEWFETRYPKIKKLSMQKKSDNKPIVIRAIDKIFEELANEKIEIMQSGTFLDEGTPFMRGTVLRIGDFSNVGKSKFAYFITANLLGKGYQGMIFSTEMRRSFVLANFISYYQMASFYDVLMKRKLPTSETKEKVKNLSIYDQRDEVHSLEGIMSRVEYVKPDFIVIDFLQMVKSDDLKGRKSYEVMTDYAQKIQAFAQTQNILVIDLSQVSNDFAKASDNEIGFVGLKGSGDLYSSADVVMHLIRNKKFTSSLMSIEIAKHKFAPLKKFQVHCEFAYGHFTIPTQSQLDGIAEQKRKLEAEDMFTF